MVFNSLSFLLFFVVILALYYGVRGWRAQKGILLVASYLFYAAWSPPFVVLIWISTVVDWFAARGIARASSKSTKRMLLLASLGTNLGLLGYFKYGGFLVENFEAAVQTLGIAYQAPAVDIVLPVGISFYTFQTLSYTIDVYRGHGRPWRSFLDFSLFVTFFPQLVAGPIVRAFDFLPQCETPRRATGPQFVWGVYLMILGLFQKMVIADALLAPIADRIYGIAGPVSFADGWAGTLAFAGQIFCDFAGYSTCAIGAALCLGFMLPDNFRFPYGAVGFSDFWQRWHISLSQWLRDYLYISLGGNRTGKMRMYLNLFVTMLLGGLWHGASWVFVIWGALHGLYLVLERVIRHVADGVPSLQTPLARFWAGVGTFGLVCIAWVFFRAPTFEAAMHVLGGMFGLGDAEQVLRTSELARALVVVGGLVVTHALMRHRTLEDVAGRLPRAARAALVAALLVGIVAIPGDGRAFIYFQF